MEELKEQNKRAEIAEKFSEIIESGDLASLRQFLNGRSSDDIAELLDALGNAEYVLPVIYSMEAKDAAEVLMLLYFEIRSKALDLMNVERIVKYVVELPSDDAADLLDSSMSR